MLHLLVHNDNGMSFILLFFPLFARDIFFSDVRNETALGHKQLHMQIMCMWHVFDSRNGKYYAMNSTREWTELFRQSTEAKKNIQTQRSSYKNIQVVLGKCFNDAKKRKEFGLSMHSHRKRFDETVEWKCTAHTQIRAQTPICIHYNEIAFVKACFFLVLFVIATALVMISVVCGSFQV